MLKFQLMVNLNCPNCGYDLETRFAAAKMTTCTSCETTLFLESGHLRDAGSSGEMHDVPLLFQVGQTVKAGARTYEIIGHARFSYGAGWWDEFFAVTADDEEVWISVDEGDVVVQRHLPPGAAPNISKPPKLGAYVTTRSANYRVTEKETATCIALRGAFAEVLEIGTTYEYINCQGDNYELLSGEFSTGVPDWYTGVWLDQYNLKIETIS
ncbi:DUF4178 domain-containing protein [Tateyamaria sp.]|uniref:DUF4178 domain-containing protein n=1 Tax=Tateyamaria sp. TaxID=1929288 RepID=UPI00329C5483